MSCKEFEERIWTYDELSVPEQESVTEHLITCAACQQAWQQAQQVKVITSDWKAQRPVPEHAAQLTHHVMESLGQQSAGTAGSWFSRINTPRLRYACMSLSAMLIIGFMAETNNRETVTTIPNTATIATSGDAATLNSAAFRALSMRKRETAASSQFSLVACLVDRNCPPFITQKKMAYENE